jgi:hypothetical protein
VAATITVRRAFLFREGVDAGKPIEVDEVVHDRRWRMVKQRYPTQLPRVYSYRGERSLLQDWSMLLNIFSISSGRWFNSWRCSAALRVSASPLSPTVPATLRMIHFPFSRL